ncbi:MULTISPECIES: GNAT family N-acetyltransferase [unclassified Photorhabdus]|uniref:GNAT family N-acetyltransferase n=1 Tax=unclassified Photorhabdus TaxID=2620880 RepID=UPI000DCC921C|nr:MULTISPECIES: GNAT family N-acetyltransferase [unclassified Photorhabdus]RAX03099.1 GNAT family N-acetyltransferase [Photorhabdus sp. S9-53]RAX03430.1 GNAT family N-acetyltransferase [Photorhabdus sp. S10-54]RAX05836.1 GNAT family N-acetyltransferase [Photorhabdus sp. S8-52]
MEPKKLETRRLILHPLESKDYIQIQNIFPQWEIVRYLTANTPWPYPDDGAMKYINNIALPSMAKGNAWFWTIRKKDQPSIIIGMISLYDQENNNRGFWLDPQWHRNGFMTEAVQIVTDFWFNTLNRNLLRAPKSSNNIASRKISIKSGMRLIRLESKDFVSGRMPSEIWEITRDEWNKNNSQKE